MIRREAALRFAVLAPSSGRSAIRLRGEQMMLYSRSGVSEHQGMVLLGKERLPGAAQPFQGGRDHPASGQGLPVTL